MSIVGTFLLLLAGVNASAGVNTKQYDSAKKSAVLVLTKVMVKETLSNYGGSGVVVGKSLNLVLSNYHLVKDKVSGAPISCSVQPVGNSRGFAKNEDASIYFTEENNCEVIAVDKKNDLVLLKRKIRFAAPVSSVAFAKNDPVVGDRVHGVFSPGLIQGTWYESYVNNIIDGPGKILAGLPAEFSLPYAIGFSAPTAVGASGAMVLNDDNRLVGIVFASLFDTGTGLAVPVSIVKKFVTENEPGAF